MPKNLDIEAMKLAMTKQIKDQILGIFGKDDSDYCIGKLHSIIELSVALQIDDLGVKVTLKELIKAQIEYIKAVNEDDKDVDVD